jgi:uncharacterized protein YkwD
MFFRTFVAFALLGWLFVPAGAYGQSSEESNGETLENAQAQAAGAAGGPDLAQVAKLIVQQTNDFRAKEGRRKLEANPKLTEAARYFADYLARTNKFSHTADGQRPSDRAKKHGYDYCITLENIAYEYNSAGFPTEELARRFVEGWKQSPGHRKNMLDPDVTETGVAIARSEKTGYYYAVQEFGRPRSLAVAFKVSNHADATVNYTIGDQKFSLPPRYTRSHEQCRPQDVTFRWPEGEGEPKALRPGNGDNFVVEKEQDKFTVKKE